LIALEGSQALTISQNITPDIVLMDAIMPNMDGFETCRRLKQNPDFANTPIIFMTGLSDTEHVVMGLKCGGVDYITKPINTTELMARMQVHLTNARMAHSARAALDTAGQNLFAVDRHGAILWSTPQVHQRLTGGGSNNLELLTNNLANWLRHNPENGHSLTLDFLPELHAVEFLTLVDEREYLLRLQEVQKPSEATGALRTRFSLTGRESDVLLWIANGKTLALRLQLEGACPLHAELHARSIQWTEELRGIAAGLGDVWLEKIKFRTKRKTRLEEIVGEDTPLSDLLQAVERLEFGADVLTTLVPDLANLKTKLPAELLDDDSLLGSQPEHLSELREDVKELLIAKLIQHGEEA
jgi:CheY-like chemotaxis protein